MEHHGMGGPADGDRSAPVRPGIAIDPVCGMEVVIEGALHVSEHAGTTYYFCGKGCRLEFEEHPERILAPGYLPSM